MFLAPADPRIKVPLPFDMFGSVADNAPSVLSAGFPVVGDPNAEKSKIAPHPSAVVGNPNPYDWTAGAPAGGYSDVFGTAHEGAYAGIPSKSPAGEPVLIQPQQTPAEVRQQYNIPEPVVAQPVAAQPAGMPMPQGRVLSYPQIRSMLQRKHTPDSAFSLYKALATGAEAPIGMMQDYADLMATNAARIAQGLAPIGDSAARFLTNKYYNGRPRRLINEEAARAYARLGGRQATMGILARMMRDPSYRQAVMYPDISMG